MRALILPICLLLAACGDDSGPVDKAANGNVPDAADVGGSDVGSASADGSAPANMAAPRAPMAGPEATATERTIPAALRGRWGMTPADCTSTRGDAKGLLVVDADKLSFYESSARPVRNVKSSEKSIGGDFAFTGEGQSWSKFQTLELQDNKLIRTESSPMASFTYVRCA